MSRDPRLKPKAGDEIQQSSSGLHLRVTDVKDGKVSWDRKTRVGWGYGNTWTLSGWTKIVANNATVVVTA